LLWRIHSCIANRPYPDTPKDGKSRIGQRSTAQEGAYKCKAAKVWQAKAGRDQVDKARENARYDETHARYVRNTRDGLAMVG
jgi:hypothetical protein